MTHDQCSMVIRYVHDGNACERLSSLVKATSTTGKSLFDLVKATLEENGLDIKNCVGDAFDDAANMLGQYNGLTAKISEVASLHTVSEGVSFDATARNDARNLLEPFLKFETVLTAFLFMRIYKITTPLTLYLQTKGLDMLQAWRMVDSATSQIKSTARDFVTLHSKAQEFCRNVSSMLEETDIEVSSSLPNKRSRKRKFFFALNSCFQGIASGSNECFE
eukprot:gene16399-18036_t